VDFPGGVWGFISAAGWGSRLAEKPQLAPVSQAPPLATAGLNVNAKAKSCESLLLLNYYYYAVLTIPFESH
jgi:hypothetical protein